MPVADRAADCWESLVAIADAAGDSWPDRARTACKDLNGEAQVEEADTAGERLLADLKRIYAADRETPHNFLYTATILEHLTKIEDAPWAEWSRSPQGRIPINARGLAGLLKGYKIRPRDGREGGTGSQKKGYYYTDLVDTFARYTRDDRDTATDTTNPQTNPVADPVADNSNTDATGPDQPQLNDVADVADSAEARLDGVTNDPSSTGYDAVRNGSIALGVAPPDRDMWERVARGYDH